MQAVIDTVFFQHAGFLCCAACASQKSPAEAGLLVRSAVRTLLPRDATASRPGGQKLRSRVEIMTKTGAVSYISEIERAAARVAECRGIRVSGGAARCSVTAVCSRRARCTASGQTKALQRRRLIFDKIAHDVDHDVGLAAGSVISNGEVQG